MKNYLLMIGGAIAVSLGIAPAASAAKPDIGISFDLAPSAPVATNQPEAKAPPDSLTLAKPLPLPTQAAIVPIGSPQTTAALPPPPDPSLGGEETQKQRDSEIPRPEDKASPIDMAASTPARDTASRDMALRDTPSGSLQFETAVPPTRSRSVLAGESPQAAPAQASVLNGADLNAAEKPIDIAPAATPPPPHELQALFHGDENSLVARAVGSAEGTRTPDGGYTWAYQGHIDPGNGDWNLGSFSYQHGASSPAEADRQQLQRLISQAQTLRSHAAAQGISLTLEAELNGIDLANQAPRAALSSGGYIDRLKQAEDMGLQGSDAVLWARTRAFLDPDTSRWNAPGLGNTIDSITADQERRQEAIARAIETQPQIASAQIPAEVPIATAMTPPPPRREETAVADNQEAVANLIISLDLPPT